MVFDQEATVESVKIWGNGVIEIVRKGKKFDRDKLNVKPVRGKIKIMSKKSLIRLMTYAQSSPVELNFMLTVTYPSIYPANGTIVKDDVSYLTVWLKRNYRLEYLWFMEFQARGAPHLHILMSIEAVTPRMRKKFALLWTERVCLSDWYKQGVDDKGWDYQKQMTEMSKVLKVVGHHSTWEKLRDKDGARKYVNKYAAKQIQKKVPKRYSDVGRFWGCSRGFKPENIIEVDVTEEEVREALASIDHKVADWEYLPKFIFGTEKVGQKNVS